jgi:integrase
LLSHDLWLPAASGSATHYRFFTDFEELYTMPTKRIPKYSLHKASGQARVCIDGRDHYLGPFDSPESHTRYRELIDKWQLRQSSPAQFRMTLGQLIILYDDHAQEYYQKNGNPTSELACIRNAFKPLAQLFSRELAADFGPQKLEKVQKVMIELGWARSTINKQIRRIKMMFKWAVRKEYIPVNVHTALTTLDGLKRGRTKARESKPVVPVEDLHVAAVLPLVSQAVADMIRVQRVTGMRPGEVLIMRPMDIDRCGEDWEYVPHTHKTEHHSKSRRIPLGPETRAVLAPLILRTDDDRVLFKPVDGGIRYSRDSYRRAITRACRRAGIPTWSPNQLRHKFATEARKVGGIEAARVMLGHSSAVTSEVYAEKDFSVAQKIVSLIG